MKPRAPDADGLRDEGFVVELEVWDLAGGKGIRAGNQFGVGARN